MDRNAYGWNGPAVAAALQAAMMRLNCPVPSISHNQPSPLGYPSNIPSFSLQTSQLSPGSAICMLLAN